MWIASFGDEEPVTCTRVLEQIDYLREVNKLSVQVTLTHRVSATNTRYQEYQTFFDQFRPITASGNLTLVCPVTAYAVEVPSQHDTPKSWQDVKIDPNRESWYLAAMERYTKNNRVGLWSIPISRALLPKDATVLQAVSTFKVKNTDTANVYDLYFHLYTNGSRMIKGGDFLESHSPVGSYSSLRMMLALAAAFNLRLYRLDVENTFQCTPRHYDSANPPVFITMPPLYMAWFRKYFPHIKLEGSPPYVLQSFTEMQGLKPAGRGFYRLLVALLCEQDIHPTSIDAGFFVYVTKKYMLFMCSETDEFLMATNSPALYDLVRCTIEKAFNITLQDGLRFSYLNFHIVQSEHGISIDQTDHILLLLE